MTSWPAYSGAFMLTGPATVEAFASVQWLFQKHRRLGQLLHQRCPTHIYTQLVAIVAYYQSRTSGICDADSDAAERI